MISCGNRCWCLSSFITCENRNNDDGSDLDDVDADYDADYDGDDDCDVDGDGDDDDDDINCVWLVVGNGAVACLVASPVTTAAVIAHLVAFCLPSPFLIQLSKISNPTSLLYVMLKVVSVLHWL